MATQERIEVSSTLTWRGNEWQEGRDGPVIQYVSPTAEEMRSYQEIARAGTAKGQAPVVGL